MTSFVRGIVEPGNNDGEYRGNDIDKETLKVKKEKGDLQNGNKLCNQSQTK